MAEKSTRAAAPVDPAEFAARKAKMRELATKATKAGYVGYAARWAFVAEVLGRDPAERELTMAELDRVIKALQR